MEAIGLGGCATGGTEGGGAGVTIPTARRIDGENPAPCHAVRDGFQFPVAPVTAEHDVVVVGGGPSGLCAAYRLRDRDVLLLEKEPRLGGNCVMDEWRGVRMSTAGAFYTESETELVALFKEIGAEGLMVQGGDSLTVNGVSVVDFFRDGAAKLPFPQKVRDDFRRSRDEMIKRYKSPRAKEELDRVSFADLLKPYAPELTQFWDRFGPSNWGGYAATTSGFVGCEAYTWAGGTADPRWTFPGGMAGAARRLEEVLRPKLGDRLRTGCPVYRVETEGTGTRAKVIVRYMQDGAPRAVRARAVIMASPKLISKYVVAGLPASRVADMRATRYLPFPVFNVCLEEPGPEPAYDNWFLDTPFTDFIPADWILYAGKGPKDRRTALTVYHPLPEGQRGLLLSDEAALSMVDGVAEGLEKHFPGTIRKISEVRVFRRGHPMFISTPGRIRVAERAAQPFGPVLFANTDCGTFSTFAGAHEAAERAAKQALKRIS